MLELRSHPLEAAAFRLIKNQNEKAQKSNWNELAVKNKIDLVGCELTNHLFNDFILKSRELIGQEFT